MNRLLRYFGSRVSSFEFRNSAIYVKHDEEFPAFSGNKVRKLYSLLGSSISFGIVSYGGAESNAMLALAHLAAEKEVSFDYYTGPVLPQSKSESAYGCLGTALRLGMKLHECTNQKEARLLAERHANDSLLVPQGGHSPAAEMGLKILAKELGFFFRVTFAPGEPISVVLPAGRGTTAFYLAKHLQHLPSVQVYAVATACSADALRVSWQEIMRANERVPVNLTVWETAFSKRFGTPNGRLFEAWRTALDHGLYLDLLYGANAFLALSDRWAELAGSRVVYLHTGGLVGNVTMLHRYRRLSIATDDDIRRSKEAYDKTIERTQDRVREDSESLNPQR